MDIFQIRRNTMTTTHTQIPRQILIKIGGKREQFAARLARFAEAKHISIPEAMVLCAERGLALVKEEKIPFDYFETCGGKS
jgi:hypothetical protein